MKKKPINQNNQIVIYTAKNGQVNLDVELKNETVWLSQNQMADLFGKTIPTINEHIKNIYREKELERTPTIRKFLIVQNEGGRDISREIEHYNLDVIISVGYRVKSKEGTSFRIWANKILKDYLVKGYAVNQKRLKEQAKYFKELQQAIKFIREKSRTDILTGKSSDLIDLIDEFAQSFTLRFFGRKSGQSFIFFQKFRDKLLLGYI